jgi:signal transduction histidine kinase
MKSSRFFPSVDFHTESFESARVRLTIIYTLILTAVLIFFSMIIYGFAMSEVYDRVKDVRIQLREEYGFLMQPETVIVIDTDALNKARKNIILRLVAANSLILLVTALGSYYLAGRTLYPIHQMTLRQQEFISNASHELRTPLTAIMTSNEVALRDPHLNLESAKEALKDSLDEATRLQRLIHNLLLLASAQSNVEIPTQKVELHDLVNASIAKVQHKAQEKNILIANQTDALSTTLNQDLTIEVLVILLENAIKYSTAGQQVQVQAQTRKHQTLLTVTDQGIGISKTDQQYLFERFYRAEASRSSEGFGLGLAIAQQLMQLQGGQISVQSRPGKGSTFTLTFPNT